MSEKGTTLLELLLAAMIIIAVGLALILPGVNAW
jgi:competence protein ComGC